MAQPGRSSPMKKTLLSALVLALCASSASAAVCVNRFVNRTSGQLQVVTLLTGKYTFQEAQAMAKTAKLEWVDDAGKAIARQFGELKVVRPMPVGCDGKTSGVVLIAQFGTSRPPSKKMLVKFDANTTVEFEQQAE
jgi:opacity protein-like surface antigen